MTAPVDPRALDEAVRQLKFRDPARARSLADALEAAVRAAGKTPVTLMHVCGSHEQAIARYGLRAAFPLELNVIMGPGCPVCVTDSAEVDEAVALARMGARIATYGDMLRVPGTRRSLADAQAEGGRIEIVYSVTQAAELARNTADEVVFFASGFETTAVTTAAVALANPPRNFSILSVHKYIPPAMDLVAQVPDSKIQGFLAAGHAASITGYGVFEPFVAKHELPVVVAGFEPLDILAALVKLVELVRDGKAEVANMYPRCVTREGNRRAMEQLFRVFRPVPGRWRGIADVPDGNLELRDEFAHLDARKRFRIDAAALTAEQPDSITRQCICGSIMSGLASPTDCPIYGNECTPEDPVGACMVSSEGACRIWHQYGGRPDLRKDAK